jgi:adenine-specific DNA-methyltransferase
MSAQERFLDLFRKEILKLDLADLDFGIYRILKYRRHQIEAYLDNIIPQKLKGVIVSAADVQTKNLENEFQELYNSLNKLAEGLGYPSALESSGDLVSTIKTSPNGQKYLQLKEQLDRLRTVQTLEESEENAIYNTLYNFFVRYYAEGDFLPVMRRGENVYYAPYNGQDVSFHWQGRGSHYVKTAEELKTYCYRETTWRVTFQIQLANTERDQTKSDSRYFFCLLHIVL